MPPSRAMASFSSLMKNRAIPTIAPTITVGITVPSSALKSLANWRCLALSWA
ncbi:MAG: hypothetical protein ACRCU2_05575 [Planktothrix sp.]